MDVIICIAGNTIGRSKKPMMISVTGKDSFHKVAYVTMATAIHYIVKFGLHQQPYPLGDKGYVCFIGGGVIKV